MSETGDRGAAMAENSMCGQTFSERYGRWWGVMGPLRSLNLCEDLAMVTLVEKGWNFTHKKSMPIWHDDYAKIALPDNESVTVQLWHIDNADLALFGKAKIATLEKGNRFSCDVM